MTSQHFGTEEGWEDWGDWGEQNNNNNLKSQAQQTQPVQQQNFIQQPAPPTSNVPIYSPFAYSQTQQAPTIAPILNHPSINQPQYVGSHQQFFNSPNINDNVNNNQQHQSNVSSTAAFSQPSGPPPQIPYSHTKAKNGLQEDQKSAPMNMYQYQPPSSVATTAGYPGTQNTFMPSPSTSPMQLPPPPQVENIADDLYTSNQSMNLPAPPAISTYETNFSRQMPEQSLHNYQQTGWTGAPQAPVSIANPFDVNQTWQTTPISHQQTYTQHQAVSQPSIVNHQTGSYNQNPDTYAPHQPMPFQGLSSQPAAMQNLVNLPPRTSESFVHGTGARFFENAETTLKENTAQSAEIAGNFAAAGFPPSVSSNIQTQQNLKQQNFESVQPDVRQTTPQLMTPVAMSNIETFYPENRERLDDVATPVVTSSSFTDRHNYLVTGQLSQDRLVLSPQPIPHGAHQQQVQFIETSANLNESFPPPGLSRMVVGQPENNREQTNVMNDVLPPGLNRMVTGTEMTPANYINYQRQADGEVSQSPLTSQRPQSNSPFTHHQQHTLEVSQQSFNTSDRNLYLVAGESDVHEQRVIPGVESDNLPPSILNPLQNLHIQDDDDFINVSVSAQERNVNVDGMETTPDPHVHRSIDTEPREEEIDGANDNTESFNVSTVQIDHGSVSKEPESDVREEAIEGANDYNDEIGKPTVGIKTDKKHKPEIGLSSEDSELRELEVNKVKPKPRRSKKYAEDSNESEKEFSDGDRRRLPNRENRSRDDYEKYRKKEKERRSGERPRRGDDTDGSKYGDSKRRTDDEDDYRKNHDKYKKTSRTRNVDNVEPDEKEKRKRDKYRESGSRRKDYAYDDDRRERRRRERYYDDESYSGRRSQNTSDREYASDRYNRRPKDHAEKDRNFDANSYYQQYAGYDPNYNYNSYYQQQKYYETLRRTNPQAYYEWYTKYYGNVMQQAQVHQQPGAIDDIGGSLRSGYNSSNEKDRASTSRFLPGGNITNPLRSMNSSFIDNTDYQSLQGFPAAVKDLTQTYASMSYNQDFYNGFSRDKIAASELQRSTPKKFQSPHGFVRLSNGVMTTIDTLNTDNGYIVKIENVPIFDKTRKLYQSYPGPLIRGVSHKKTVIEFCEEKMKQDQHVIISQRASHSLLWSYLILMLRQNGNYTEGDISELLMKNSEEFKGTLDSSVSVLEENKTDDNTDVSESEENVTSEKHSNSASQSQEDSAASASGMSDKVIIHKFRDYLLYGNINDALDFATDNNLWGHALFLASKVDRRQHANVMLKFANKLPYNDPLQTLYQIMSGRMPACATHLDDKWGDWRPHLAMIISNCTDKPELVKRSIMSLGDTLANRGDIFGSQFCYLLVEPLFSDFSEDGKIVLLGSSHHKSFKEFVTDDAIIMSEVYEYARSLSDEHYFVPSLQKYKFLLAGKMLDYGLQLKCLLYMEQIAKCIINDSNAFDKNFVAKVYMLADRLKFYDPVMEKSYEDNFNNNGLESTEDQQWLQDLASLLNNIDDSISYQPPPLQEPTPQHSASEIYNPMGYPANGPSIPSVIYDPMSQHQTPTHVPNPSSYEVEQSTQAQDQIQAVGNQTENYVQYQQPDQSFSYEYNNPLVNETQGQQYPDQSSYDQNVHMNYEPQQPQQTPSQTDYGYGWDQNQQQQPTITMGNATSNKFEGSTNTTQNTTDIDGKKKAPVKKPEVGKSNLQGGSSHATGGWFGGIFSKLSMKPKNQMILPDDKNPTILWDETTKKWVNKDEDGNEVESFKPPPKMGDMMGNKPMQQPPQQQPPMMPQMPQMPQYPQSQQVPQFDIANHAKAQLQQPMQTQQQTNLTNATSDTQQQPPAPAAAPNMFKMQKGRNLKKSYVDILGNAGQTVSQPKELAPQMDMQFFNPVQQQPQGMQFYNPNDFQ